MRISKKQKETIRKKIITSACELFVERGYHATTMRKIAQAAEISGASIYTYFPNKEKIFLAFYSTCAETALTETTNIKNFKKLSLQEKIQLLTDNYLSQLCEEKEFVSTSYKLTTQTPFIFFKEKSAARSIFKPSIINFIEDAMEEGNIPDFPSPEILSEIICEFINAVVLFWINDESEDFDNTSQMVDLTLSLGEVILSSGLLNKASDLCSFFIKTYLHNYINQGSSIVEKLKLIKEALR